MIFSATLNFYYHIVWFLFTKISHTVFLQSFLNRNLLKIKCIFFYKSAFRYWLSVISKVTAIFSKFLILILSHVLNMYMYLIGASVPKGIKRKL